MRPSAPTLTTMSPNCDGSVSRPCTFIVYWNGRALLGQRRPADDPGGDLDVLLFDRVDDVARGHASRRQLVGISHRRIE